MGGTVVVRSAVEGDAEVVAAVIAAAFAQYRGRLVPESGAFRETAERISRELADGGGAVIAELGGETVGCVMTRPVDRDLYFGRLAVVPPARGRGIARRLVEAVEAEAARRGLAGVRLGVRIALTENQRLFTALGYVETSREAHPGFDHPTSITMRKAVPPVRDHS
ncbi:GNAT family N-acetyltransferase [Pseudonocardia zijingensis]|uniref:GNAT family N-acetyltransferase n=1 Tax=Pseudonocardia zijingensis TaxID=153376 RepID=A0ABP3ZZZ4_9PSEU